MTDQHQLKRFRSPRWIMMQRPLHQILSLQLLFNINGRLNHSLVPQPIVPRRIQRQHIAFRIQIRQHVLHAQRTPNTDHNLGFRIVDGHKEWRLPDVHMESGVDHFNVAEQHHSFHGCVIAVAAIVIDNLGIIFLATTTGTGQTAALGHELTQPGVGVGHQEHGPAIGGQCVVHEMDDGL